jgi:hypothetical protein
MPIGRIFGVWALLAGLLFWNGALGLGVWQPLFGRESGEMMTAFIGLTVVFAAARPFLMAEPAVPVMTRLGISLLWLVLTVVFELALGRIAQAIGPRAPLYGMWDGSFWPLIVMSVGLAPLTWLQRRPLPVGRVTK